MKLISLLIALFALGCGPGHEANQVQQNSMPLDSRFVFNADLDGREPYSAPNFTSVYHPQVLKEVEKIFEEFGSLYMGIPEEENEFEDWAEADMPWSGFWYPFYDQVLYKAKDSVLAKLDDLVAKLGGGSSSIRKEARERFKKLSHSQKWAGLCDAWSFASILTKEPKDSVEINGIKFSIADQKALYTYAHSKYSYKQYGLTYKGGDSEKAATFQDIKPEGFHKIVMSVLGQTHKALVIDDMSGVEIWNTPLFKYTFKTIRDPDIENAYLVTAKALLINHRQVESDELTTFEKDVESPTYTYRLYVDHSKFKTRMHKGKEFKEYLVIAGQWTGASYASHPDNVKIPIANAEITSANSELNNNISLFKQHFKF